MSLCSRQVREELRANNQRLKPESEGLGSTEHGGLCGKSVANMAADCDVEVRHSALYIQHLLWELRIWFG